jgi:hypothetical protein
LLSSSVNFSASHDGMFVSGYAQLGDEAIRGTRKYEIKNNAVSSVIIPCDPHSYGYVDKSGAIIYPTSSPINYNSTCVVVSSDGYYDYYDPDPVLPPHAKILAHIATNAGEADPFWSEYEFIDHNDYYHYHTPYGEMRTNVHPVMMGHIHGKSNFIQSYGWADGAKRVYSGSTDIVSALCTQAECTETDYMGLAYIPGTDRL